MRVRCARLSTKLILLSIFSFFSMLVMAVQPGYAATKPSAVSTVTISSSSAAVSNLNVGTTHEHYDADSWYNAAAVASAKQVLQSSVVYQNQHMMGFGVDDPEPVPGKFSWGSLDARIQLMRDTHAKMVITLCCAPGWMRPYGYQDDWSNIEIAPDSSHVEDFAHLAALVAARYPDVKYFQVWNELKGMWSDAPGATPGVSNQNRWDYERYTTLYNAVYDAVKKVRPDALLGGPYVVVNSDGNRSAMSNPGPSYSWGTLDQRPLDVIKYWLAHKHGADFITVDGSATNDDNKYNTDAFGMQQKFADIDRWIHAQSNLPIWWAEWYVENPTKQGSATTSLDHYNALQTTVEAYMLMSGASVTLLWQPQGDSNGYSFSEGLFTDTRIAGGGKATKFAASMQAFKNDFGPGTSMSKVTITGSHLMVIASRTEMMLINQQSSGQTVIVDGRSYSLNPYQVLVTGTV